MCKKDKPIAILLTLLAHLIKPLELRPDITCQLVPYLPSDSIILIFLCNQPIKELIIHA